MRDDRRAVALARQAVPDAATGYADLLWLSRLLWAAGQPADAESHLRRAVAVAADRPECWSALAEYLARSDRKADAVRVLADAGHKLSPEAAVALAPSYEAAGQPEKARELYRAALAARPDDPALLRGAALVHLRAGETEPAEALLRRLATRNAGSADAGWARRTLAVMLAGRPDFRAARQALELLGPPAAGESPADLHTRALVLAAQPERERRKEAVEILERLAAHGTPPSADRLLLGQLYDRLGDWPRARALLLAALAGPAENAPALAYYIRALLRHDDSAEAAVWLAKLERLQPGSYAVTELGTRLRRAQGRTAEAETLLTDSLSKPGAQVASTAALADELGLPKAAEAAYRRLAADPAHPQHLLALATFLGRQGRTADALAACDQARRSCPIESVAAAGVTVLMATPAPGLGERQKVAGWIDEALRTKTGVPAIVGLRAALMSLEGRTEEAIALYRKVASDDPDNALARNNLAYLLAATGGPADEARSLLERARAVAGPVPEVRITEAVVELQAGRAEVAARLLQELADEAPSAVVYYHLARARFMAGDRAAALAALNAARRLHLKPTDLHPLDRPAYQQLLSDLGPASRP
jgi:tetratricopeptide (TPR) repeat protein